jgi:nucleoside-diphosphate-sugar epimerase
MDTVADISAARHALQWEPRFTLFEGVRDMHARQKSGA